MNKIRLMIEGVGFIRLTLGLLFLMGINGCTAPTMQQQIDDWGLTQFVQVNSPRQSKEALISQAFTDAGAGLRESYVQSRMNEISRQEEEFAQQSLTHDRIGLSTVWTNQRYGEMTFLPGKRKQRGGQQCREFEVDWISSGSHGIFKQKESGQACLNVMTRRWEWANY